GRRTDGAGTRAHGGCLSDQRLLRLPPGGREGVRQLRHRIRPPGDGRPQGFSCSLEERRAESTRRNPGCLLKASSANRVGIGELKAELERPVQRDYFGLKFSTRSIGCVASYRERRQSFPRVQRINS